MATTASAANFTADPNDAELIPVASPTTPSSSSTITAFARFEFEPGSKGNEGTKVLMVEWEDEDISRSTSGSWQVSWSGSGKSTQLHADENRPDDNIRRLYFLLPPGQTIPPVVTLKYEPPPDSGATAKKPHQIAVNPLPAIFPPELGEEARQKGKKGVLHTIWAKQRLRVLEKEIQQEQEFNLEGIALEMARAERDWIQENFAVYGQRPSLGSSRTSGSGSGGFAGGLLHGPPMSPRTPGGSRLNEKLRGLSLNTREKDLNRGLEVNTPSREFNPLSPETADVAVSFFGSMRNRASPISPTSLSVKTPTSELFGPLKTPQPPSSSSSARTTRRLSAQQRPDVASASASAGAASDAPPPQPTPPVPFSRQKSSDSNDDLFAKAISPRTPAIGKSPFSFSAAEVMPYLQRSSRK